MRELDAVLRAAVDSGELPGAVAIAADADGVIYEGAAGVRQAGAAAAMAADTVFRIASMTKAVTAAAAMQLVEQGRLSLDQPAGEIAPELAAPQVLEGFAADGTPRLRPARGVITLRNLLTHSSGFGYDLWNADLMRYHRETGLPAPRTGRLAGLNAPLIFDPGTRWQYGIGIDWVGRLVEAAAGEDLERVFQHRLFEPLGMRDTSYLVRPDMETRLAAVHARTEDGVRVLDAPVNPPREFFPGGGGLYSTSRDYMRFLRMLLREGELDGIRVLEPKTVRTMLRNHLPDGVAVEKLVSAEPAFSNDVELLPGMAKGWGLSFLVNLEPVPGARSAGSAAWAGLNNTYYWLDPGRKLAGALFTQILPFADPPVLGLLDRFERGVYEGVTKPGR